MCEYMQYNMALCELPRWLNWIPMLWLMQVLQERVEGVFTKWVRVDEVWYWGIYEKFFEEEKNDELNLNGESFCGNATWCCHTDPVGALAQFPHIADRSIQSFISKAFEKHWKRRLGLADGEIWWGVRSGRCKGDWLWGRVNFLLSFVFCDKDCARA